MSLKSEATPTIGRSKSSSRKPTARNMARLGARPMPSVVRRLRDLPFSVMESARRDEQEHLVMGPHLRGRPVGCLILQVVSQSESMTYPTALMAAPCRKGDRTLDS